MLQSIKTYFANQAREPTGWFGRWIAPRVFNRENRQMERQGLQIMNPDNGDHILEIGFGNGRLLSEIISETDAGKVYGIDISEEMVQLAGRRNHRWIEQGRLELKQASVEEIPYPDDHFDKIFTANTTYFWPDPQQNIHEVKRVLKPGGFFVCVLRPKHQMESISVIRDTTGIFQNLYEENEIRSLFRQAGFKHTQLQSHADDSDQFMIVSAGK